MPGKKRTVKVKKHSNAGKAIVAAREERQKQEDTALRLFVNGGNYSEIARLMSRTDIGTVREDIRRAISRAHLEDLPEQKAGMLLRLMEMIKHCMDKLRTGDTGQIGKLLEITRL